MKPTQSINKAKNGSVSIVIDGVIHYIDPKDIELYPGVTLENYVDKVNDKHKGYDDIVDALNSTINLLEKTVKELKGDLANQGAQLANLEKVFENTLSEFMKVGN